MTDDEELLKRLVDDELLTINTVKQAAARISELKEEVQRLRESGCLLVNWATHDLDCTIYDSKGCNCGYTNAWKQWRFAMGDKL